MARIGVLLLLLIQWSNVYAWWCSFNENSDGTYQEGSMYCEGISVEQSLEDHFCVWFKPDDPVCDQYQEPICADLVDYKTESCQPNYTGAINYSRNYSCKTLSWSEWIVSSNNCTELPPSCIESIDTRVLQCPSGYEGTIEQQRISSCPNPYGTEVWSDWLESQNSCIQSTTDPVSPISVTSPINPVSPTTIESVTVPQTDVPQTINPAEPTIESIVQEELSEASDEVETNTSDKTDSAEQVKENKQDRDKKESKDNVDEVVDNSKEIVHGFGLVLSLEIFNKPMQFYQPPLEDPFSISQELSLSEDTRQFQLDLLKQDHIENYYDSISNYTWERIRSGSIY